MKLCDTLRPLIISAVKLLLYTGVLDIDDYLNACMITGLPGDKVNETRCGDTTGAIEYLLNFTNTKDTTLFLPNKAYKIEISGTDEFGKLAPISHAFILITNTINSQLIDSYIACRGFTCRFVDMNDVRLMLERLKSKFDSYVWFQLTGCVENTMVIYMSLYMNMIMMLHK